MSRRFYDELGTVPSKADVTALNKAIQEKNFAQLTKGVEEIFAGEESVVGTRRVLQESKVEIIPKPASIPNVLARVGEVVDESEMRLLREEAQGKIGNIAKKVAIGFGAYQVAKTILGDHKIDASEYGAIMAEAKNAHTKGEAGFVTLRALSAVTNDLSASMGGTPGSEALDALTILYTYYTGVENLAKGPELLPPRPPKPRKEVVSDQVKALEDQRAQLEQQWDSLYDHLTTLSSDRRSRKELRDRALVDWGKETSMMDQHMYAKSGFENRLSAIPGLLRQNQADIIKQEKLIADSEVRFAAQNAAYKTIIDQANEWSRAQNQPKAGSNVAAPTSAPSILAGPVSNAAVKPQLDLVVKSLNRAIEKFTDLSLRTDEIEHALNEKKTVRDKEVQVPITVDNASERLADLAKHLDAEKAANETIHDKAKKALENKLASLGSVAPRLAQEGEQLKEDISKLAAQIEASRAALKEHKRKYEEADAQFQQKGAEIDIVVKHLNGLRKSIADLQEPLSKLYKELNPQ